ncbi:insig1 [Pungitius sinensis]
MPRLEEHCWSCSRAPRVETKHSSGANWLASKAEEMMCIITSVLRNAYGSLHDVRTANLIRRGLVLFTVGAFLALVLNLLQIQRHVTLFPEEVMTTLFSSAWWIPPCCGTGAAVVGLLYPCLDSHLGEPHKFKREWASVMRCIAVFVGINHASVKLDFDNNVQLSLTLAALSLGLWWTFDRSRSGFGLGITTAVLGHRLHAAARLQRRLPVYVSRLLVCTLLAAVHILLWRRYRGKHRTANLPW